MLICTVIGVQRQGAVTADDLGTGPRTQASTPLPVLAVVFRP